VLRIIAPFFRNGRRSSTVLSRGRYHMVESAKAFLKIKLADWAESWLLNLRQEYRPVSRLLSSEETASLRGYFASDLLAMVRVAVTGNISNPPFFSSLPQ